MKPFFQVKFKDGSMFEVPTIIVAQDRANYYHQRDKEEFPTLDDALKDTAELFAADTYEIEDWAKNNMNWDELAPHARLVGYEPAERDWMDCELSFHDQRTGIEPFKEGESLLDVPLELAMSRVFAQRHVCSVTAFNGPNGAAVGAMAFIQGTPDVVQHFLGGLTALNNALFAQPAPDAGEGSEEVTH
ncbi:hypothetical protein [Bordetella phage vB_BbrM_PHB04]|uniref:Uncharacterized protein n=1 Tax=Bordetella phage vB_BbrM_PHB04 TaxID=2029657 RepID=A0A291LA00_9CAUD|nr:hypothetical protein HOS14_gp107 [Bordetella phage vB_BbrM_PHB04]ATI15725.1 hypothetical protein [Bordetella phage vB_BbrM_PHB04]